MMRALWLLTIALAAPASAAPDGAAVYKRCAACHLPSGAGVPGAFPPLGANVRAFAGRPDGRRYLGLVVTRGLTGTIGVAGQTFRGVMPAQSALDDAAVAAVLNHVLATSAKAGPAVKPFTAAEIADTRRNGSALNAAAVGKLRPAIK